MNTYDCTMLVWVILSFFFKKRIFLLSYFFCRLSLSWPNGLVSIPTFEFSKESYFCGYGCGLNPKAQLKPKKVKEQRAKSHHLHHPPARQARRAPTKVPNHPSCPLGAVSGGKPNVIDPKPPTKDRRKQHKDPDPMGVPPKKKQHKAS